jgi:hypothetical protein
MPPDMPPLLLVRDGLASLIANPTAEASTLTHPVPLQPSGERLAFVTEGGELVIWEEAEVGRLAVGALVDARLLVDESARVLLLTDPTTRYVHGVLGDKVEAGSITLVETHPAPRVVRRIEIPPPAVIEGIAPIWVDLTGDGRREIVVTLSDAAQGARLAVFSEEGELLAAGPAIGQGLRWRHQLVAAPLGPDGEMELADVLTPHIGGVVEFYRMSGDRLEIAARAPGYSSHAIGSRNLDAALAGDLDGDGRVEVLVPDQAKVNLGAVRHEVEGAREVWSVPIGGGLGTNLAAVSLPDGTLAVGVGREDSVLRLWLP